ncbi:MULTISPECIES: Ig-like domain-containing protein [unclassified Ruminococcus]|uniref:Ig-like domain-containing protein n=1 Tax=unclassified Ruminococcus TaxID=2608920 RepID=UPI00210997CC|nr:MULTISPECIES: Ig-like domain-containing protein [unclassified Ruminococcus]MCQ4023083.1 hypothetical protein [Ruminococcus sp. zg-924]MCQ4115520.1 hypothetical protein [Ruminococcus sp. zg-921]
MRKPRKILSVIAASSVALTSLFCVTAVETTDVSSSAVAKTVYGDVDHNGYVSTLDAILVMKCALGENAVKAENLTAAGMPKSGLKLNDAISVMEITLKGSPVRVKGVAVSAKSKTLEVGKTFAVGASVNPSNATNKYLAYSTSNSKVATVNSNGTVTAKAAGTAEIKATSVDGGYTAKCKVTVKAPQPKGTIKVSGVTYKVCDNYSSSYLYDQRNYSKFNEGSTNVGCSATAEAIGASMYFGKKIAPDDPKIIWTAWGAGFGLAKVRYYNNSVSSKLKVAYTQLQKGNPTIINTASYGSDHWLTIVGVKPGASSSNLKTSDFLVANPWGGVLSNLETYLNNTGRWIPYDYSVRAYE